MHITQRLTVTPAEEIGVLGYFGDTLVSISNRHHHSPATFDLVLPQGSETITLDPHESHSVGACVYDLMRSRFMPYVRASHAVELSISWHLDDRPTTLHPDPRAIDTISTSVRQTTDP